MIRTLCPDPTINNSLDDPANFPLCVLQRGWRRCEDAADPPDLVDRLEAVERLQIAKFAALKQELALLKA
ncbi:unnamed protein product [Phytophthora fragariaefolia]|uniref:Unnamed protein product n=1 Tax=Phytophthora fragariaefolia TaxID=1490495 RepID=A0A9W6Y900_9STRA|nr:unnamed protein product [Phytophthora fragariaefolia]